ncbi:hypothetical protein [Thermus hydrothermalis]|uniref:hypothetical protein n=1 Tax=Thermus hydrothermalis TaxID=2908148 RepID=UPI001FAB1EB4|nr:hypothetical protein [Thermus hydrothermalis]
MTLHERIRQLERGLTLAIRRMGVDPERPEQAPEVWKEARQAVAWGQEAAPEGRAYVDAVRLVDELELYEALAGVEHVRVRPAPADRPGEAALARLEALGYEVRVEDIWGPRDGERWWWARARYEGREVAQAIGATREEALECLMGELGL